MPDWLSGGFTRSNLIRFISAVVLSTILWAWVTMQDDPETTRTFASVPVEVINSASALEIRAPVETVQVTISGPESVVAPIQANQLAAVADASEIKEPGQFVVKLEVENPGGIWRSSTDPAELTLSSEELMTVDFPLQIETTQPGLASMRIVGVQPATDTVTISGQQSAVSRVVSVVLPVDAGQQVRTFAGEFVPVPLDADQQPVTAVTISPSTVAAVVEMSSRGKSVAVLVTLEGNPAAGYEVSDRAVNPVTVVLDGPDEVLAQLVAVRTAPVSVYGISASFGTSVGLDGLPDGLTVIEPASGLVDVFVEITQPGVSLQLPEMPVTIINAPDGSTVVLETDVVEVEISGPADVLAAIDNRTVQVVVDVAGLPAGQHLVSPSILLPPQVQWIASDPAAIRVTIESPAASPVAEGTPEPS